MSTNLLLPCYLFFYFASSPVGYDMTWEHKITGEQLRKRNPLPTSISYIRKDNTITADRETEEVYRWYQSLLFDFIRSELSKTKTLAITEPVEISRAFRIIKERLVSHLIKIAHLFKKKIGKQNLYLSTVFITDFTDINVARQIQPHSH